MEQGSPRDWGVPQMLGWYSKSSGTDKKIRGKPLPWNTYFPADSYQRRSWRGCDRQLTQDLDPGNWELLGPSLSLEWSFCPLFPQWEPFSRTQPWDCKMLLRPSGLIMCANPGKASIETSKILVGGCGNLLCGCPTLLCKFPWLLSLPPTNLAWSVSFFALPVWKLVSDFTQGIPEVSNQQLILNVISK